MSEFAWIKLKRMIGLSPTTPLASQEGQLRYVSDVLYLATSTAWKPISSPFDAQVTAAGTDPTITNTPVGTYPGAGTTPGAVTVRGNDTAMRVSFTTGTVPATGMIFHVAFATARADANYVVFITKETSGTAPLLLHTTGRTTAGFDVSCVTTAPAAATALAFGLLVVGV